MIHSLTKNRPFSFRKLNSTFFYRFSASNYDSVLSFFPARKVSEIFLNESTENALIEALIEWLQKDTTKCFLKSIVYVVSLIMSVVSKTGFGIFLSTSCLSQIWKIRITLIPIALKSFEKVQIHHSRSKILKLG
jgi:hypothetical protein